MSSQQSNQNNKSNTKNRNGNSKRHVGGGDVVGEELLDAAEQGNTKRLLRLLTNGVDVNYRNNLSNTALHWAAAKRNIDCVQMLIDHGANIHARTNNGATVIHAAVAGGSTGCVQLLVDLGCDIHVRDNKGATVLHQAAFGGNTDCVQFLINLGCDIHARDNNGATVLQDATYGGHKDCVQFLINRGCDIHARTNDGWTLLHDAAQGGNIECVKLLHGLGVDISAKNAEGNTAYDIAKQVGKTKTARLLQQLSYSNPITSQHNIDEEQSNAEPDQISMEIDDPTRKPKTVIIEQKKVKQNQCHRCQCKSCTSKDDQLNDLQQENIQLKRKMAENEQQTEKREAEIKRQMSALETRLMCIDKLEHDVDGLQRENTTLKEEMLQIVTNAKQEFEGQSNALRKEHAEIVSTLENQMDAITAIQEENTQLKDKVTAIANRLVSLKQREHGHSGLPLIVSTMAGFNFGNIVGKDFMHPDVQHIFNHDTFEAFKNHSEPQFIAEYMCTNNVITEKQYQEIKGHTTDIGKAEHIWSLMKLERQYLEAVREALRVTNQNALASMLQQP